MSIPTPAPALSAGALPDLALPSTEWSICLRDSISGDVLAHHEQDRQLRTASVGKIFLLIEVARQIAAGELDPEERLGRDEDDLVADSGVWYLLGQDALSIADLCVLVGAFSDNLATNVLVRRIGIPAVGATSRGLGWTASELLDRIRPDRGPADPPTLSWGTAAELSDVLARLARDEVIDAQVSATVRRWLAANSDLSMVAAAFDLDPLAHTESDRGITLIDKTGTISTARVDVGTVAGPRGSISYAVLANWAVDTDPRDAVLATMRVIGSRIRAAVS